MNRFSDRTIIKWVMKLIQGLVGLFFIACMSFCTDYIRIDEETLENLKRNQPPKIDHQHVSPHPMRLLDTISLGPNCSAISFKVPPIVSSNRNARLYYLGFFDGLLTWPESVIEPERRDQAVIVLNLDMNLLKSLYSNKLPADFFARPHLVEFYVSDVQWKIPEIGYNGEAKHGDYAYWIVRFNADAC